MHITLWAVIKLRSANKAKLTVKRVCGSHLRQRGIRTSRMSSAWARSKHASASAHTHLARQPGRPSSLSHHAAEAEAHTLIRYLEAPIGTNDHGVVEVCLLGRRTVQNQNEALSCEFRVAVAAYVGVECQLAAGPRDVFFFVFFLFFFIFFLFFV